MIIIKNQDQLISFEPAQLFKNSIWYVQFKVIHPQTGKIVSKRIKCNKIKNLKERERYAKRLINEINKKLYSGWNPFIEQEAPKGFVTLEAAIKTFIRAKERELRPDSLRSYRSFIATFNAWLKSNDLLDCYCINFDQTNARAFMDHIYNEKQVGNRTFNNYCGFMSILFNWMIEQRYVKLNPFAVIKKKRAADKRRVFIPADQRQRIQKHLREENFPFFIVTQLVYFTLIRPKEITFLKPEYFDLDNQTILIPGEAAKNGHDRVSTIPDVLIQDLKTFNFNGATAGNYIFGKEMLPGKDQLNARRFAKIWAKMRKDLSLPDEFQLYSLRDTGIIQMMIDGVSPEEVMKQADHSSLEITTLYAKHANPEGSHQIKTKLKKF